ncbi:MAG TPA: hypothetical protein VEV84_06755 [Pyrinomonadaceae bacterium]|nr:hypothetical protein [Pyrinomonadaceae bacterium]
MNRDRSLVDQFWEDDKRHSLLYFSIQSRRREKGISDFRFQKRNACGAELIEWALFEFWDLSHVTTDTIAK